MKPSYSDGMWKAVREGGKWKIHSQKDEVIATIEKSQKEEPHAHLIAASPVMFEALSGLVQLIGEEDLPDNGELSGAAICDLARAALSVAAGK
ncbi:hypothetical protein X793_00430 [Dehalococcoides mccartyi CG4]|uniref:hypothetical protein n=1 Tax=Dehalococcoides mccartyi TaxID=61435 RepID=UPI0004E05544|nr:hypothetical protein [Dehalococcoides mccartyi]AII60155.1 hypothetical protein X793_00430 [Dehalococcoides mccartyi CG4]